jgi:hypothetical protein
MTMRTWMIGVCAMLSAGAAHAEEDVEPYAKAGEWEITAEPAERRCTMARFYGSVAGDIESLIVLYDAEVEGVLLSWGSDLPTSLPREGSMDLGLAFYSGPTFDESWGKQAFRYERPESTNYFVHVFRGTKDVRQILGDLAVNEGMALLQGEEFMTSLSLDALFAVEKLRECSRKLAAGAPQEPLPG